MTKASKSSPEPWGHNLRGDVTCGLEFIGKFKEFKDATRAAQCVNACEGLNPKVIPKIIQALKFVDQIFLPQDPVQADFIDVVKKLLVKVKRKPQ